MKKQLIKESGIRDINDIAKRYNKAKIYFHIDLDGVTSAIAMKVYLESYGIEVVDAETIQYGTDEFAIKKPDAS
jgi:single-stranded DNA-specific DHH superfamily exonuclease